MNGRDLTRLLRHAPGSRGVWQGVFPRNKVPRRVPRPSTYIFNTDPDRRAGEHWVAVHVDRHGLGEYFDSYGLPPYHMEFYTFLERNTKKWRYSGKQIQGLNASTCGDFCVYFLVLKMQGFKMKDILSHFGNDTRVNSSLVKNFVARLTKGIRRRHRLLRRA